MFTDLFAATIVHAHTLFHMDGQDLAAHVADFGPETEKAIDDRNEDYIFLAFENLAREAARFLKWGGTTKETKIALIEYCDLMGAKEAKKAGKGLAWAVPKEY